MGLEANGKIYGVAVDYINTSMHTIVTEFESATNQVMALEFDRQSNMLWAFCDNNCKGNHIRMYLF